MHSSYGAIDGDVGPTTEVQIDESYQQGGPGVIIPTQTTRSKTANLDAPLPLFFKEYFPHGLHDSNGNDVPLQELTGKLIALYFTAEWCPPNRILTPQVVDFRNAHTDVVEFVLVDNDVSEEVILKMMVKHKIEFPSMRKKEQHILNLFDIFRVESIPKIIVINEIGNIVSEYGREAIEYNPENAANEWLEGKRGCNWLRTIF